jgi:CheY-like chemotaxis protein
MLAVSDSGTGMDAETLSHIFEPFFTTKEKGRGTGLGLATVYGIVKQSGGNIWVYSEPGKGTAFKIYLPRVEEVMETPQIVKAPRAQPGGSETVLLVEDEESVRGLVRGVLEKGGYTVLEASRPADALVTCRQYEGPIHLLLTDVVLPQMSGPEVADRLQIMRPETRVLYMSGYTGDAIVHYGVLERGVPFVEKPFTPDQLARKVREVLDAPLSEVAAR